MLSFIVPAHNEERELPQALAAIHIAAKASTQPYEILVVDDDSTDRTVAIAEAAGARVISVRHRHIAAVRNAGARAARGEVFFFVDADTCIKAPHVLGALAALEAGSIGGGARVEILDEVPGWARVFIYLFTKVYFAANLGAGAFLYASREGYERCGGFDEQYFAGEEIYFTQALKKLGRFTLLRTPVTTSGRKLRMYSGRYLLGRSFQIVLSGKKAVRSREKLDLWYEGKRES